MHSLGALTYFTLMNDINYKKKIKMKTFKKHFNLKHPFKEHKKFHKMIMFFSY